MTLVSFIISLSELLRRPRPKDLKRCVHPASRPDFIAKHLQSPVPNIGSTRVLELSREFVGWCCAVQTRHRVIILDRQSMSPGEAYTWHTLQSEFTASTTCELLSWPATGKCIRPLRRP